MLRAIEAGITTVVDWCDISGDAAHLEAALRAHADSGVRTVFVPSGLVGHAGRQGTTVACGSPDVVEGELDALALRWAQAREAGRRIHARAGTAAAAGGEVAELGRRGLLGPDVTLCHCTRLSAADFDAVASSSTAVALTPASDMAAAATARRRCSSSSIAASGPAWASATSNSPPAMSSPRCAPSSPCSTPRCSTSSWPARAALPNLLGTRDVIRYATIDGARVAGLSAVTGSLSPGKRADVIVLRADRPNIAPVNDPIGAVVWGMDTSNIDWVFVGGVAVVADGELTADVARARTLAVAAQRRVEAAAGVPAGAGAST